MSELLGKKVKLFSLSANQPLALEIAKSIGIELAKCEVVHFADGEINVNINETVRGHDVFVVQPTSSPVNEHLMELLNSKIQEIPGVTATETLISLEQSIKKEIPIQKKNV